MNDFWEPVEKPNNINVIGTKRIFTNKTDGVILRKRTHLAQGYTPRAGIDFDKIFAYVARLELIHIQISISCTQILKLF